MTMFAFLSGCSRIVAGIFRAPVTEQSETEAALHTFPHVFCEGRMIECGAEERAMAFRKGARMDELKRREFLSGLVGLSLVSTTGRGGPMTSTDTNQRVPMRELGKTGQRVSCVGLGGFHLGKPPPDEQGAINLFHAAVDRGITFSDNSWDYNNGESERRVGKALKNGYREKVFVMTKFDGRTKSAALQQLDESLSRLEVDHIDLWQFHENIRLEDPDRFFAEGGAVEAVTQARKAGKIRFVGFTGHKDPSVHLRMLELAQKHNLHFDTVQMPLNVMDAHFRSFEKNVVPIALKQGVGILGMKPFAEYFGEQSRRADSVSPICFAPSYFCRHYRH
jgi:diketogulonate reductase-like aldo/keto reductase